MMGGRVVRAGDLDREQAHDSPLWARDGRHFSAGASILPGGERPCTGACVAVNAIDIFEQCRGNEAVFGFHLAIPGKQEICGRTIHRSAWA